jgi:hypothetical protein
MTNKKIILTLFSLLIVGMMASMANAAVSITMVDPASSSVIDGVSSDLYALNVSTEGTNNDADLWNISYEMQSAGLTANNSWVEISSLTLRNISALGNLSFNVTGFNFSGDSGIFEDSDDYQIRATITLAGDSTNTTTATATTGITYDRTTPSAATSFEPAQGTATKRNDFELNATVTGSTVTSCTITWTDIKPANVGTQTMTHSGSTCTLSFTDVPDGIYGYTITTSDETNTTVSAQTTLSVDAKGVSSAGGKVLALAQTGESDSRGSSSKGLAIAAVITIGALVWLRKPL